ncbi:hypothetical protein [Pseudooceanicola marinus]|uniref:hypothetical protein n=1 Tax=Pseudooceanicola marinus TaxID=396013 RepID=UPI001CD5BB03|nr:hypothetical protein [Pseudooceanicola marinus]MCA1335566.1 hypothetical protein [Pseudooceanicola marinus]
MKRLFAGALAVLLMTGCASSIMESYVGKSIQEPILDYGPPSHVMDISANRRAFQWSMTNSGVIPITTPTTTTVYGNGGYATAYSQSTTYVPHSNQCVYTLTAIKQGDDYIVDGFRKPTLMCE